MSANAPEKWIQEIEPTKWAGVGDIAAAFAKAQLEMQNPKFDSANPFFKSKFASLAAVRNAVVPCLAKHGICLSQDLVTAEGTISCSTILTHLSGQQMRFGPLTLPVTKDDAQGYAAAGTYAKRISMQSIAAVVGDEDDDGNAVSGKTEHASSIPPAMAQETAKAMSAIIDAPAKDGDHEGLSKAIAALDYHQAHLAGHNELQLAAADLMTVAKKNSWKALISQARKAEAADRNTDPRYGGPKF